MKNKKVKTMLAVAVAAAVAVAGSGICFAVKHGRKKGAADTGTGGSVLEEEGLTEEKVKKYLLRLFQLYEDNEFDELADFSGNGNGVREYAADNYSGQIFPYIKEYMKDVMMLEGDDGAGKEPFDMTDELFCCPACLIGFSDLESGFTGIIEALKKGWKPELP